MANERTSVVARMQRIATDAATTMLCRVVKDEVNGYVCGKEGEREKAF